MRDESSKLDSTFLTSIICTCMVLKFVKHLIYTQVFPHFPDCGIYSPI